MELVFTDTSALYALTNRGDRHHDAALEIIDGLKEGGRRAYTTNYIVAETHVLVLARLGHEVARRWLAAFTLPVEQVTELDQHAARAMIVAQGDKSYSLTDATSFQVMRRLGTRLVFAFDGHFSQAGFEIVAPVGRVTRKRKKR